MLSSIQSQSSSTPSPGPVYAERPDVYSVLHTEPPYINAFGALGRDIVPVTTTGLKSANGTVPIMPFRKTRGGDFAREMLEIMGDRHGVVWEATRSAVREVTSAGVAPPRAMAVSCLGEAVTPIDGQGCPLGPSIVSFDRRAAAYHDRLVERVGRDSFERVTGMAPMPHYTVAKWSWLATETPDVYRAAAKLVLYRRLYETMAAVRRAGSPGAPESAGQPWA